MTKALVVYDSVTGNTEKMALAIGDGLQETGLDIAVKKVTQADLDDLVAADAIVLGSPVYFSTMSARMKAFIDKTITLWPDEPGKLKDKLGAVFTSCDTAEGGCDTTLLALIHAMMWHGMLIAGHPSGACGAVSVGKPDEKCLDQCRAFGRRIGGLAKRL